MSESEKAAEQDSGGTGDPIQTSKDNEGVDDPDFVPTAPNSDGENGGEKTKKDQRSSHTIYDWIAGCVGTFAAIATAIFTFMLYSISEKMWITANHTLSQMKDSTEIQSRAYAYVKEARLEFRGEKPTILTLITANSGHTPASDLWVSSKIQFGILSDPIGPVSREFDFQIAGGESEKLELPLAGITVPDAFIALFNVPNPSITARTIRVEGVATYRTYFQAKGDRPEEATFKFDVVIESLEQLAPDSELILEKDSPRRQYDSTKNESETEQKN